MEPVLELSGVCKRYGEFCLDHVNFQQPKGSIMGLVGENGAGKSTIIKLILNLIARDAGEIRVFGFPNREEELRIKESLGVVFDECSFPDHCCASDVGAILRLIYKNWDEKAYRLYLDRFSLPEKKAVKDYSRGMKMKLSIAAALSHRARFLLLDEATSGLDPVAREEILDVFWEFVQDEEHSILLSSHMIGDLAKIADYIALLHKGQLLFCRRKDKLLEEYGMLRCGAGEFGEVDPALVVGSRRHEFGVEALLRQGKGPAPKGMEPAGLEEIVLYHIKGAKR
ncbi:MAG: ABC transporter ATP-binding protein [Oscillospiraceae bacterium]|nr:ABC transporter ATP-binding protein [Oscillospiraceae bacterium]